MTEAETMTPAARTYFLWTAVFMGAYVALNTAAILGLFDLLHGPARWALAMAVTIPILGHIWAVLGFIRQSDEFVGPLTARRFIVAAGIAMGALSAWGFAESYADARHLPGWMIYPAFWAAFGLASVVVKDTKR